MDPVWVPPDWHYVEQAKKKGLGILPLTGRRPSRLAMER
jgi:hypothetical protein